MQHMQFVGVARLCVVQERKHRDNGRNDVVFVESEEDGNHLLRTLCCITHALRLFLRR